MTNNKKIYTVEELKQMNAMDVIKIMEEKTGQKIPTLVQLELALRMGAGDAGIKTLRGPDMVSAETAIEKVNWEKLAELVNS